MSIPSSRAPSFRGHHDPCLHHRNRRRTHHELIPYPLRPTHEPLEKLDTYMDVMIAEAREDKMTREEFQQVLDMLERREALAVTEPDLRAKLNEQIELLKQRFKNAQQVPADEVCLMGDEIVRLSLHRAIEWLKVKAIPLQ